jgi:hypothetical protein
VNTDPLFEFEEKICIQVFNDDQRVQSNIFTIKVKCPNTIDIF